MPTDKEYFCDNIRQCEKEMYAYALGILKNETDVADVIQESILKAYCSLHNLKDKKKFRQWIMTIIHNTAIDLIKKRYLTTDIDEESYELSLRYSVDQETKITLWKAVNKLRLPYREIIILFYYQDCSIIQIAKITSTPAPTVRQQLSRGRKMLAGMLNKEDFLK